LGATTEEPKAMDWVFSRSQRTASWEKPGSITVDDRISIQHQVTDCAPPTSPVTALKGILWEWWNLQATTEARCNPKCAPSITWPGEKKWRNSSCSIPTHSLYKLFRPYGRFGRSWFGLSWCGLTQIRPYLKLMFRPYHICMRPTANPALCQMEKNN
jgi:hypothetical protein